MLSAFIALSLGLSAPPEDEAKELLAQARERLSKAKLLQVTFTGAREIKQQQNQTFTGLLTVSMADRKLVAELTTVEAGGKKNPPYRKSQEGDGMPKAAEKALA